MKPNESKLYNKKILNYKNENQYFSKNNKHIIKKANEHYLSQNKENIDTNIINQNDVENLFSTELYLDEIKLKADYAKIESELRKLKNTDGNRNSNKKLKDNKSNSSNSFNCNNIQTDADLFYYSDDEEKEKEEEKMEEKNNNNDIKKYYLNLEKIDYGIDENGNPISIKQSNNENKKIIAYIIQSDVSNKNNDDGNYLVDLNGKKIPKMPDGDFNYLYNNMRIIIRNFDVQNPKLRIYGANQRYSSLCSELSLYPKNKKKTKNIFNYKNEIKKDILYQRKKLNDNQKNINRSLNKSFKILNKSNSKNDIINQTKKILDRNKNKILVINKDNHNKYKNNNLLLNGIYLDNLKNGNKTSRDNEKIKTDINISNEYFFINRLKNNVNPKKNKYFNLLNNYRNNIIRFNSTSNHSELNKNNNPLLNNSTNNIFKNSFSFLLNDKINKKNNPLLQKCKSPKLNINKTIKGIEYNIKKIQKNIKNALQKIIISNKKLNRSLNQPKNNISLKVYNSFNNSNNISIIELPKKIREKKIFDNEIQLNKKFNISTSPHKIIRANHSKCSVLSKQANDMIQNFMNKSMTKRNKDNNYINKIIFDENNKNNVSKNKNKLHINKRLINSLRNSPKQ